MNRLINDIRSIFSMWLFELAGFVAPEEEKLSAYIAIHNHLVTVHRLLTPPVDKSNSGDGR